MNHRSLLAALALTSLAWELKAEVAPIVIDGQFEDWADVPVAHADAAEDVSSGTVDFRRLWLADDDEFLFIRVETTLEIDPSENNGLTLYIDGGNGSEMEWQLGNRQGTFRLNGTVVTDTLRYTDLGFRGMPTLDATDFEFAVRLDAKLDGVTSLFQEGTANIRIEDSAGGDSIPDDTNGIAYTIGQGELPMESNIDLLKSRTSDLRVATYNVLVDNIFNPDLQAGFRRQIQIVDPDIISFQEIGNNSPEATRDLVESWLPSSSGEQWFAAGGSTPNNDTITVSRFPISNRWDLYGSGSTTGNLAVLLDTQTRIGYQTLLINAHPPAGPFDSGRQREVDAIMAFIRDAKEPDGIVTIDPYTPIIISGDMNFVGRTGQLITCLTGDISDNQTNGPDFSPDWDSTDLTSITPRHSDQRMGYTWRSDPENNFWPGHLDYLIYSDSSLEATKSFVVHTPSMSSDRLALNNLQATDSLGSDHLLFVADFRPTFVDSDGNGLPDFWEILEFQAVGATSADDDSDFDGLSNIEEYAAGTDPQDINSRLILTQFDHSETQITLSWSSTLEKDYQVESSMDLSVWTPIGDLLPGTNAELQAILPNSNESGRLFYRIKAKD